MSAAANHDHGCDCPLCGGRVGVVCTKIVGPQRVRYFGCKSPGCSYRPPVTKQIVPLAHAPARRKRLQRPANGPQRLSRSRIMLSRRRDA